MYEVIVKVEKKYSICRYLDDEGVDYIVSNGSNGMVIELSDSEYIDKIEEMNVG